VLAFAKGEVASDTKAEALAVLAEFEFEDDLFKPVPDPEAANDAAALAELEEMYAHARAAGRPSLGPRYQADLDRLRDAPKKQWCDSFLCHLSESEVEQKVIPACIKALELKPKWLKTLVDLRGDGKDEKGLLGEEGFQRLMEDIFMSIHRNKRNAADHNSFERTYALLINGDVQRGKTTPEVYEAMVIKWGTCLPSMLARAAAGRRRRGGGPSTFQQLTSPQSTESSRTRCST
jgi:hypothetical protein